MSETGTRPAAGHRRGLADRVWLVLSVLVRAVLLFLLFGFFAPFAAILLYAISRLPFTGADLTGPVIAEAITHLVVASGLILVIAGGAAAVATVRVRNRWAPPSAAGLVAVGAGAIFLFGTIRGPMLALYLAALAAAAMIATVFAAGIGLFGRRSRSAAGEIRR